MASRLRNLAIPTVIKRFGDGGGIRDGWSGGGDAGRRFANCTVADNMAFGVGGGIFSGLTLRPGIGTALAFAIMLSTYTSVARLMERVLPV